MAGANFFEVLQKSIKGISELSLVRQLFLMIGLSASIAVAVAVVMWSRDPNYRPLYSHIDAAEITSVLDSLDKVSIRYKFDSHENIVLVPSDKIHQARIALAAKGLPKTPGAGFEMLDKDQGITTSRFLEDARYKHALEGELSRTISNIDGIVSARVHLAIPRQSVFVDDSQKPSASVLVDLGGSEKLDKSHINAIARLVASSVPSLTSGSVTVVDQMGHLLTVDDDGDHLIQTKEQFDYKRKLERVYEKRIESILTPLLGIDKVRARVSADLDFTHTEQTRESFSPNDTVVRSEEVSAEQLGGAGDEAARGVPGQLSRNKPRNRKKDDKADENGATSTRTHTTRNYEVSKQVSHTMLASGEVTRISIAVVVDDKREKDAKSGKETVTPLTDDEIAQISNLVKNAVGFNDKRGDSISIVNSSFAQKDPMPEIEPTPIWQQAWVLDLVKKIVGGLFALFVVFGVIRPFINNMAKRSEEKKGGDENKMIRLAVSGADGGADDLMLSQADLSRLQQRSRWNEIKTMADEDPKRIAQVMKSWAGEK